MSKIQTISITDEVYFSEKFQKLIKERKLSRKINSLLKSLFDIKEEEIVLQKELLEEEIKDLAVKKAKLETMKEELEKKEQEELNRYVVY